MTKPMSKTATIAHFAKKFDLKKKFVATFFEELAALLYKEAKNSFTLPGLGKLVLVKRKARMGTIPRQAKPLRFPRKQLLSFE